MSEEIGLIGVGMVGARFTQKLVAAGHPVVAYDIDGERVAAATALGAEAAASPREVATRCRTLLLSLPGSHAVDAAMQGSDGVLAAVTAEHFILDTGTSRPGTAVDYAARVGERGGHFIDTPLTYRGPGPIFLVGGSEEEFRRAETILRPVAYKVAHCGPVGAGQRMKLVNQFILAARLAVYAEGAHLARELELDPEGIVSILEFGEAGGALQPNIRVEGGRLLAHHTKDLEYLMEIAEAEGIHAPLSEAVTRIFQETRSRGESDWAQAAIVTHWEEARRRDAA